jgi:hypothetical protein
MSPAPKPSPNGEQTIHKAWIQYSVVVALLGAVVLSVAIVVSPLLNAWLVEYVLLPSYETEFGFRGGRNSASDTSDSYAGYAIIEVTPGGILDTAGARNGDIPVDHHSGLIVFYTALYHARNGESGTFVVVSSDKRTWDKRRTIRVSR